MSNRFRDQHRPEGVKHFAGPSGPITSLKVQAKEAHCQWATQVTLLAGDCLRITPYHPSSQMVRTSLQLCQENDGTETAVKAIHHLNVLRLQ